MNDTNAQLNTKYSLTADERAAMKHEFVSFMQANPMPTKTRTYVPSPYIQHFLRVPAFMALFLVVMGGTAFAAEKSLPNDFLYPVKTAIIEPLFIQAPARTPLARAKASQALVERRLAEAETLIDQNELDAETTAVITAAVDEHTNNVQTFVATASQSGELSDALDVGSDLESVLEAHTEVLETIAGESTATEAVSDLIDRIADQADEVEAAGDAIEQQTSGTVTDETDEYIQATASDATSSIELLRTSLTASPDQSEELIAQATEYLTQADAAYESGTAYLELGQKSAALPQLRDALQFAQHGQILMDSHEDLTEGDPQ